MKRYLIYLCNSSFTLWYLFIAANYFGFATELWALPSARPTPALGFDPCQTAFWQGPPKAENSFDTWKQIKDAGYTVVMSGPAYTETEIIKMLEHAESLKLHALVEDKRINIRLPEQSGWQDQLSQILSKYSGFKSFYGILLRDEPSADEFVNIAKVKDEINRQLPNTVVFINLNPIHARPEALGTLSYNEYVEQFIEVVKPDLLSYDNYPFYNEKRQNQDRDDFIANLEIISKQARINNIPAWNTFLSSSTTDYRSPNISEMRWQSNLSLAYGMKGLMHWYYWPHIYSEGLVDKNTGLPNNQYRVVQRNNLELKSTANLLGSLRHIDVVYPSKPPTGGNRASREFPLKFHPGSKVAVGLFKADPLGYYLYVVNLSHKDDVIVSADVDNTVVGMELYKPIERVLDRINIDSGKISFPLEAGGGKLFYLQNIVDDPIFDFSHTPRGWKLGRGGSFISSLSIQENALSGIITGAKPYILKSGLHIRMAEYDSLSLELKLPKAKKAKFYWSTKKHPSFSHERSVEIELVGDDAYHMYKVELPDSASRDIANNFRLTLSEDESSIGEGFKIRHLSLSPKEK